MATERAYLGAARWGFGDGARNDDPADARSCERSHPRRQIPHRQHAARSRGRADVSLAHRRRRQRLRSPTFYLVLAGVGGLWAGSFALDKTMRANLHQMSSSDADLLQHVSYGSVGAAAASLYLYGFSTDDTGARDHAITGAMGAGVASLVNLGFKYGFGRLRPTRPPTTTPHFSAAVDRFSRAR